MRRPAPARSMIARASSATTNRRRGRVPLPPTAPRVSAKPPLLDPDAEIAGVNLKTTRADRGSDGHFTYAPLGSCEDEIRDVRTGDEHDESHGTEQHQQRRPTVPNNPLLQRDGHHRRFTLCSRKGQRQTARDSLERRRCLPRRLTVLQSRQYLDPLRTPCLGCEIARREDQRLPEFGGGWKPDRRG